MVLIMLCDICFTYKYFVFVCEYDKSFIIEIFVISGLYLCTFYIDCHIIWTADVFRFITIAFFEDEMRLFNYNLIYQIEWICTLYAYTNYIIYSTLYIYTLILFLHETILYFMDFILFDLNYIHSIKKCSVYYNSSLNKKSHEFK